MDRSAFDFWIAKPLKNKSFDSLQRVEDLIKGTCLRRTKGILADSLKLPEHSQKVQWVELDTDERVIYDFFKRRAAELASGGDSRRDKQRESTGSQTVTLINFLRRICDHGGHLLPQSALAAWKSGTSESINWKMMRNSRELCAYCDGYIDDTFSTTSRTTCHHTMCSTCSQEEKHDDSSGAACPKCAPATQEESVAWERTPTASSSVLQSESPDGKSIRGTRGDQHPFSTKEEVLKHTTRYNVANLTKRQ